MIFFDSAIDNNSNTKRVMVFVDYLSAQHDHYLFIIKSIEIALNSDGGNQFLNESGAVRR